MQFSKLIADGSVYKEQFSIENHTFSPKQSRMTPGNGKQLETTRNL